MVQGTYFSFKERHCLIVKREERILHSKEIKKQAGFTVIILERIEFKVKLIRRDKEEFIILTKEIVNQEDITILSIFAPSSNVLTFIKNVLLD